LREIIGKTLGEKVMAAECLVRVMKDGSVAAILQPHQQLRERTCRLVPNSREIGNGYEFERSFCRVHTKAFSLPEYFVPPQSRLNS
jgi:hypothetical protein